MADRGLALLDASTLLMVIEERGELRVAAASGADTVRLRIMPVQGSALGALYLKREAVSLERPRGPGGGVAARTRARSALGAGRAAEHGGTGRRPRDRAAQGQRLPRPRPAGAQRVRGERRAAACRRALGRDRTAALRHGGARARAHALGAGDPRREHPGHRRAAPAARERPRPRRPGGAEHGRRRRPRRPRPTRSTGCAT